MKPRFGARSFEAASAPRQVPAEELLQIYLGWLSGLPVAVAESPAARQQWSRALRAISRAAVRHHVQLPAEQDGNRRRGLVNEGPTRRGPDLSLIVAVGEDPADLEHLVGLAADLRDLCRLELWAVASETPHAKQERADRLRDLAVLYGVDCHLIQTQSWVHPPVAWNLAAQGVESSAILCLAPGFFPDAELLRAVAEPDRAFEGVVAIVPAPLVPQSSVPGPERGSRARLGQAPIGVWMPTSIWHRLKGFDVGVSSVGAAVSRCLRRAEVFSIPWNRVELPRASESIFTPGGGRLETVDRLERRPAVHRRARNEPVSRGLDKKARKAI